MILARLPVPFGHSFWFSESLDIPLIFFFHESEFLHLITTFSKHTLYHKPFSYMSKLLPDDGTLTENIKSRVLTHSLSLLTSFLLFLRQYSSPPGQSWSLYLCMWNWCSSSLLDSGSSIFLCVWTLLGSFTRGKLKPLCSWESNRTK